MVPEKEAATGKNKMVNGIFRIPMIIGKAKIKRGIQTAILKYCAIPLHTPPTTF